MTSQIQTSNTELTEVCDVQLYTDTVAVFVLLIQLCRLVLGDFIRINIRKKICKQGLYERPLFTFVWKCRDNDACRFAAFL